MAGSIVTMAGSIATIVKYKKLLFALTFTELAVSSYGKGATCEKLNGVGCVLSDLPLFFLKIF